MCEPAPRLRNDLPPSQTRTSSQRRRMIKFGADGKTPPAHVSSSFLPFASLMCSFDAKTRCGTTAIRLFKKQWLFLFRFRTNLSIVSRNKACLQVELNSFTQIVHICLQHQLGFTQMSPTRLLHPLTWFLFMDYLILIVLLSLIPQLN